MSDGGRTRRRVWPRLLLALAVGALFFEVGLRVLLTSPWTRNGELARSVGGPARFAFPQEDLYWRFVHRLATSEAPTFEPQHDEQLGWVWPGFEAGSYEHRELGWLQGRRPVFLFGDSYSACLTGREACFQGLMERSPLADRCQLLNYGVCGYGFDQTCLLTRAVVARWQQLDPVVVVGLLVDDDLKRMLIELREYPKPRLRVEQGRLVVPEVRVPSRAEYASDPAPLPASWAWAWMRQAVRPNPLRDPESSQRRELTELTRVLLADLVGELRARELDFFFVLFHTAHNFPPGQEEDWRTGLVCGALDELDAPWYDVREELVRRLAASGGAIGDFYIPDGEPGSGHYDAEGNEAAFAVIQAGLSEVAGIDVVARDVPDPWAFRRTLGDEGGSAAFVRDPSPNFRRASDGSCIVLRSPGSTPTTIHYALGGRARRFRARLWAFQPDGEQPEFVLSALLGDRVVWEGRVRQADEPLAFELDLAGADSLELRLAPHLRRGAAVLSDPTFE